MPYQTIIGSRCGGQRLDLQGRNTWKVEMTYLEALSERLQLVES
jgi:hypothetical protein